MYCSGLGGASGATDGGSAGVFGVGEGVLARLSPPQEATG